MANSNLSIVLYRFRSFVNPATLPSSRTPTNKRPPFALAKAATVLTTSIFTTLDLLPLTGTLNVSLNLLHASSRSGIVRFTNVGLASGSVLLSVSLPNGIRWPDAIFFSARLRVGLSDVQNYLSWLCSALSVLRSILSHRH